MTKRESDIIKGIAILCMLFHHLYTADRIEEFSLTGLICNSEEITRTAAKDMKVCVAIFALMTGYGMLKKLKNAEKGGNIDFKWHIHSIIRAYLNLIKDTFFIMVIILPLSVFLSLPRQPGEIWGASPIDVVLGFITNITGVSSLFNIKWFIPSWWYLRLAVLFILIAPLMHYMFKKRFGIAIIIAAYVTIVCFVPSVNPANNNIWRYFPSFFGGMLLAWFDIPEKIYQWMKRKKYNIFIMACVLLLCLVASVFVKHHTEVIFLAHFLQAVIISLFGFLIVPAIPFLSSGLMFLGHNSKYMWLIHAYILTQLIEPFIFSLRNIWLIFAVLVIISLIVSVSLKSLNDALFRQLGNIFCKKKLSI